MINQTTYTMGTPTLSTVSIPEFQYVDMLTETATLRAKVRSHRLAKLGIVTGIIVGGFVAMIVAVAILGTIAQGITPSTPSKPNTCATSTR